MNKRTKVILLCIALLVCLVVILPFLCWAKPWSYNGYYTQPWVLDTMNPFDDQNKYMQIDNDKYFIYLVSNNSTRLYNRGTIHNKQKQSMTWTDEHGRTSTVKFIAYSYKHSQGISKIYNPFKLYLIKWYELNKNNP